MIAHDPVAHVGDELASEQGTPHAPQFARLVSVASQPSAVLPLQFAKPMLQLPIVQMPEPQLAPAFAKLHVMPQPPQFASVRRSTSQPFAGLRSQSA